MRDYILSILWIFPFIAFFLGYQLLHYFSFRAIITTPNITGYHLHDGIKILSASHLNARILKEKEDENLPEGIIITQSPRQGQTIKAHQSVFLVVTRRPAKIKAPNFYNKSIEEAQLKAQESSIHLNAYPINSIYPKNNIIASNINPLTELDGHDMAVYYSDGLTPIRIMPDFIGLDLESAIKLLKDYGIKYQVTHKDKVDDSHNCNNCKIIEQVPSVGSLIDLKKQFVVQLTVKY